MNMRHEYQSRWISQVRDGFLSEQDIAALLEIVSACEAIIPPANPSAP